MPPVGPVPPPAAWGWAPPPPSDDGQIVPLRPYGLGTILRGVVRVVRAAPGPVAAAALLVFAISSATGVAAGPYERITRSTDDLDDPRVTVHIETGHAAIATLGGLAAVFVSAILVPVTLAAVAGARPAPSGSGLRAIPPYLLVAVLGLPQTLLLVLGRGNPSLTLLGYGVGVVATWLTVALSLGASAAVAEGTGPVTALRRSRQLVHGRWWRTFGIRFVLGVVGLGAGAVFGGFLGVVAVGGDGSHAFPSRPLAVVLAVLAAIGVCVVEIGTVLLYVEVRCRTEGLAWSLAAARRGDGRAALGPDGVYGGLSPTGVPSGW